MEPSIATTLSCFILPKVKLWTVIFIDHLFSSSEW